MKHSEHLTAAQIKKQCEELWNKPGLINNNNGNVFEISGKYVNVKTGKVYGDYLSAEQKARRKGLSIYNKPLAASILAQAEIVGQDKNGKPLYRFNNQAEAPTVQEPAIKPARKSAQRVTQRKIDAAAAILAKLDKTQWAAFFARFGVKSDIAEKIAANDNLTEAAREFLKAALAA
jgi:hypothetical protein